jgi:hypothetical protein
MNKDIFNHRGEQGAQRNTEIKKRPNFFARAKKLESSFFALAKNEKLKALCLCDLCVNSKQSFQCPVNKKGRDARGE